LFPATASHELRTPLAAVYGAAQTLLRHDFALDERRRHRAIPRSRPEKFGWKLRFYVR